MEVQPEEKISEFSKANVHFNSLYILETYILTCLFGTRRESMFLTFSKAVYF